MGHCLRSTRAALSCVGVCVAFTKTDFPQATGPVSHHIIHDELFTGIKSAFCFRNPVPTTRLLLSTCIQQDNVQAMDDETAERHDDWNGGNSVARFQRRSNDDTAQWRHIMIIVVLSMGKTAEHALRPHHSTMRHRVFSADHFALVAAIGNSSVKLLTVPARLWAFQA